MLFGFGAYPNVIGFESTVIDDSFEVATLPAANLKTEEPSEVSRINSILPNAAYWQAFLAAPREIGGMALVNVNLSPGGLVRFIATGGPQIELSAPSAIADQTNITGAVTNIDESIDAPDANFITPTIPALSWMVHLRFPTPAFNPNQGAHMSYFALRMIRVETSGTVSHYPTVTASLYEAGALKRVLGSRPVSVDSGDGQLLYFTFDPAELDLPDLSNAELKLNVTAGSGDSGDHYAKLNTVSMVSDMAGAAGVSQDSGWIASPSANRIDYEQEPEPSTSIDYFPETPWLVEEVMTVMVLDDQAVHDPVVVDTGGGPLDGMTPVAVVLNAPPGYIQAGVWAAGPTLELEKSPQEGPQMGVIVEERGGKTEGGQSYAADSFRRRTMSVNFLLNRREVNELLDGVDYRRGKAGAFYVNLEPDLIPEYSAFISGWVTYVESGLAIQFVMAYFDDARMLFTKQYKFEEKL